MNKDVGPLEIDELLSVIKTAEKEVLLDSVSQRIRNREFAQANISLWKGFIQRTEEEIEAIMNELTNRG